MAKALREFYSLVVPHVLGCPEPLLDQALLHAASRLCQETNAVQETNTQGVIAGVTDYDVDVPSGMRLSMVIGVWHGARKLGPVAADDVALGTAVRGDVGGETVTEGEPVVYYQKAPFDPVISVFPAPKAALADGLAVRAAYEPLATATTLPDLLLSRYSHVVADGAIAFLMRLPGQFFSNPALSDIYEARFNYATGKARVAARAGLMRRRVSVQPRSFA